MYGWICPRCGTVNNPRVRKCDCKPRNPPTPTYAKPIVYQLPSWVRDKYGVSWQGYGWIE